MLIAPAVLLYMVDMGTKLDWDRDRDRSLRARVKREAIKPFTARDRARFVKQGSLYFVAVNEPWFGEGEIVELDVGRKDGSVAHVRGQCIWVHGKQARLRILKDL